jgi:hypothetical protein
MATKLLKLYEMFYGMKMLYELVQKGTKELYYDHPDHPRVVPDLQTAPYERELARLKEGSARQDLPLLS